MMYFLAGGCAIVLSFAARAWRHKRMFTRRNAVGVEQYSSYSSMMANRTLNNTLRLSANALSVLGVFLLVLGASPVGRKIALDFWRIFTG